MKSLLFEIKTDPVIPPEIKQAASDRNLAIFIGAGLSRFVGCTGWGELANNLIRKCEQKELINHFENQMLSKESDMKKKITICNQIFKENGDEDSFMIEMRKSLNDKTVDNYKNNKLSDEDKKNYEEGLQIFKDLFNLNGLFLTTNADRHIDSVFQGPNIIYKASDFKADELDSNKLYKIHGSIKDENSLVFTVDQYINTYLNERFVDFLEAIFSSFTVLFVGYGLSEFELLDYLVKSSRGTSKRHYFLKDYFKHEDRIYKFEQMYFEKIGITLIPYEKDKLGYNQLKEIIKDWVNDVKENSLVLQRHFNDIDEALENPM
jgi:hypothetical protein